MNRIQLALLTIPISGVLFTIGYALAGPFVYALSAADQFTNILVMPVDLAGAVLLAIAGGWFAKQLWAAADEPLSPRTG